MPEPSAKDARIMGKRMARRFAAMAPSKSQGRREKRGASYKVWIEIERIKPDGDPDQDYAAPLPDCVGAASNERDAMARAWEIVSAFGVDPENSDCRPSKRRPPSRRDH